MVREWRGQFCLKGIVSVEEAKRAVGIGCSGSVLSNLGGRQLGGARSAFDQLAGIVRRKAWPNRGDPYFSDLQCKYA